MSGQAERVHFDEEKVKATIEKARSRYAADLDKPGSLGAQARMKDALVMDFGLALIREINRGTQPSDLFSGVACIMAHFALTLVFSSSGGPEGTYEQRCALMNALNLLIAQSVADVLQEPEPATVGHVMPEQAGRA